MSNEIKAGYKSRQICSKGWLTNFCSLTQVKIDARGSSMTMAKIAQSHIKNWKVPIPPAGKQSKAVTYLDENLSKLDAISEEVEFSISLLKEHWISVINSAVTGKVNVRNYEEAAA